jgi:hypothetical protein
MSSDCLWAAWSELSVSGDGKVTFYADGDTIRRDGATVKVLTMADYQEAQKISATLSFLSVKMQEEVDCADQKSRHLNLAAWSENKGEGKVVGTEKSPAPWRQASSDSQVDTILRFACAVK